MIKFQINNNPMPKHRLIMHTEIHIKPGQVLENKYVKVWILSQGG